MKLKFIILLFALCLAIFTVNGLEIKDVDYYDSSQYLVITVSNPDNNINANISIIGYINNKIDTQICLYNYTIPKESIYFISKKVIFKEKGMHIIQILIKDSKGNVYVFSKKINITWAYNSKVPVYPEEIPTPIIEIEGISFGISPTYNELPFYDIMYVTVRNNDIIPHYVNVYVSGSVIGKEYAVQNDKIVEINYQNNSALISWSPHVYVPPKSKVVVPLKVNFEYSGEYKIIVKATDENNNHIEKTIENTSPELVSLTNNTDVKIYKINIQNPLDVYDIECENGYEDYCYSNWFDIKVNNTVDYDVYGTLRIFLCEKEGNYYKIFDNVTISKYFLGRGLGEGYVIPIKLDTSKLNPYNKNFVVFVLYNTGGFKSYFYKTFKKPITINGLEVKNYPKHYYFVDENIYYDVYVNITNNLSKRIYANISITDIYNKTYSMEVKLNRSYNIVKFRGLKINAKELSHNGKIRLKFIITAITPPYEKYYIIKKNETPELSLIPTPPVCVQDNLNDEIFAGYYQNISFVLKKLVGKTVYARVYITVPKEIKNSAFFDEKYLKIGTMKEIPVNIKTIFLKEYNGPIYIHVDTEGGVRECVVTRIIKVRPIVSCYDVYLNNYSVYIKIRNRTQGFVSNEPIVGYPVNVTVYLKSAVPNLKGIEIWAVAMDKNGKLINCSKKKKINIYGTYKKVNISVLFNDSLEGYLIIYAKTGEVVIPLYYEPILVTYPVKFNLKYNVSYPWAKLILSHNYPVPIKVTATVGKFSKNITIYPFKEETVPFYVGKNRDNITVSIEVLNNISTIKKFKKTFYFRKYAFINISNNSANNETIIKNIIKTLNITNASKSENSTTQIQKNKTNRTKNTITPPPNIVTENTSPKKYNISKEEWELFCNITGITALKEFIFTLKGLLYLILIGLIIIAIVSLIYEPTRSKILSIIAFILYKLKGTHEKHEKPETIKLPEPPRVYVFDVIYLLGDTVKMEIYSEVDVSKDVYILSPTNKKYRIEIIKTEKNKYLGIFKIPENEVPGQYFIVYKPENLSIGGFLVVDIKKNM
ncbi:conserved hypothetical protein [Methanocaldococcus sp. FS406-22]|uniref:hypothetical protein n=1 Tax=Methanocaldococcus sp. (strain FS406-22) TaxID=644281 RepID=UPI0001C4E140|nr:hypothetical protein [Methanocaldococcus sp. FS406-22]ADC69048.1 conserved hypothetical protein [Methanocaldococcus sp. FS406-22]